MLFLIPWLLRVWGVLVFPTEKKIRIKGGKRVTEEHMPYPEKDVIDCAKNLKNETGVISADALLQLLYDQATATIPVPNPTAKDEAAIREIKEINNQLRHRTVCKICMDKEVNLVYLPCGHLVSCSECGSALINCPICRVCIKGVVHAFL